MTASSDPFDVLVKCGLLDADGALDLDVLSQRLAVRVELGNLSEEQAGRVLRNQCKRVVDSFIATQGELTELQRQTADRVLAMLERTGGKGGDS